MVRVVTVVTATARMTRWTSVRGCTEYVRTASQFRRHVLTYLKTSKERGVHIKETLDVTVITRTILPLKIKYLRRKG